MAENGTRVGVYIDLANISLNGGYGMRFDVLRRFACRDGGQPVRLNVYLAFDEERASGDPEYRSANMEFHSILRDFGFKVIEKKVKWYLDDRGNKVSKSNADLDLAVDALLQSDNLDRVVLVTGDADFVQVVRALQNKGCRVEVLAFENVGADLRKEADLFVSGFLVPELLPFEHARRNEWGKEKNRARGICYQFDQQRGFGFVRFMNEISPAMWVTDTRDSASPYKTAFFHYSHIVDPRIRQEELPSRDIILEFTLNTGEKGLLAEQLELVYSYSAPHRSKAPKPGGHPARHRYTSDTRERWYEREDSREEEDFSPARVIGSGDETDSHESDAHASDNVESDNYESDHHESEQHASDRDNTAQQLPYPKRTSPWLPDDYS